MQARRDQMFFQLMGMMVNPQTPQQIVGEASTHSFSSHGFMQPCSSNALHEEAGLLTSTPLPQQQPYFQIHGQSVNRYGLSRQTIPGSYLNKQENKNIS